MNSHHKTSNFELPRIYPITDVAISGFSHLEQAKQLIAGGAKLVQLREKSDSPRSFYEAAAAVVDLANADGVRLIINDRVDIAMAVAADGVHLGQDDIPPESARKILGPDAIIGFSTHSVRQAARACLLPIDYLAIGPIFPTMTKADPDAIVGLNGIRKVRDAIGNFPLVAIGGITEDNLSSVFDAGADSAAVISSLISPPGPIESKLQKLIKISRLKC